MGIHVYAQQVTAAISLVLTIGVILYLYFQIKDRRKFHED